MDRGTVDAAVQARRGGGRQFALGARQAGFRIVEDVLVGARTRLEHFRIARQKPEIRRFGARGIDEALAALVAFVASPLSSATNGAALRADGGLLRSIL